MLTFDYETEGIVGNPVYSPPRPVGVAIKVDDQPSFYLAWGHPTNNNTSWEDGAKVLKTHLKAHQEWLAHNAPFEAAVSRKWIGIRKRVARDFHDSQYLIFLSDPYASSLSLKPSAERILGWAPEEQDAVREWILRNVPGVKPSEWGAHICKAPGDLVGKYACGDTDRTYGLYAKLMPQIVEAGMLGAYHRELDLAPILSESSVRGMRLDVERLERDLEKYSAAKKTAEDYIHKVLGEFNLDSDAEFAAALDRAGQVTEWVLTPTGKRSTARKNLVGRVRDPELLAYVGYRGVLDTCLGTFAGPWLAQARAEGGRLHPQWNQVRGDRGVGGDLSGTRTGRMSCRGPNLQNVPNDFEGLVIPPGLPPPIEMRRYLLPEEGHVWLKRDFSAQEMRIMAHFAEGKLFEAFKRDPATDPHVAVQQIILENSGIDLSRKYVKITGFGIMYGRGVNNLSLALGVDQVKGKATRDAYYAALPEVRWLADETRRCGRSGQPIVTWGGRLYYREPDPARDLSYKLLNYLIQGSAADQTKQSLIDWHATKDADVHLLAAVHDEINISAPKEAAELSMRHLREQMDAERFDVPFMSEGYIGPNWADIKGYK